MVHPHQDELKHDDGSWKYTNALADQTSPYLLQHAHNPVDWFPWGDDAFDLSRRTGKPIFLSVGYSTCYWCHVMERQVFENPRIAALMNEYFVNVKVDREERPDIDDIYMNAVHVMGQQGGWPMSVFLTPAGDDGLQPFYAGTYFPPESMHGRPGFPQILEGLHDAWHNRRDEVVQIAQRVTDTVRATLGQDESADAAELSPGLVQTIANQIFRGYDETHGGFGNAPKFPVPNILMLMMRVYESSPQDDVWHAIAHTLDRMARGGMYDQVGGGFHRYSTDAKWLVPHFEKMLYDNGQLVEAYLDAQRIRPDEGDLDLYPRIVRHTCDYVLREMTDDTGTFWSAQDAEVDAAEGGNYLWTPDEVRDAIEDDALGDLALRLYGLDLGTNFTDPHLHGATATNVLFVPKRWDIFARGEGMEVADLIAKRDTINECMLAMRDTRKQPGTDDKVLASWNGMMIAGLARAGHELDEPRYVDAAARAADAVLEHMRDGDGTLLRTMRKGVAKIPAFLEDYAFVAHGLIALHRATTGDAAARYLDHARDLCRQADDRFAAPQGGYFDTLDDQADLFVRTRSTYDGAISSGNSQMVHNLIDLYEITGDAAWFDQAVAALRSFAPAMQRMGHGMSHMTHALLRALSIAPTRFSDSTAPVSNRRQVVTVSLSADEIDLSTGQASLDVTLSIGRDYHINAPDAGSEGVVPTSLKLVDGEGLSLSVDYPPGKPVRYDFADDPIAVYEGDVTLSATITKTGSVPDDASPSLLLRYQVCTDMSCLSPREGKLPVTFRGFR